MPKQGDNIDLSGILTEDNADTRHALSLDENGILIMPEGYKYCKDCKSLTPHQKEKGNYICIVCGYRATDDTCDNCGYEFDPEIGPGTIDIKDTEDEKKLYTIYPEPFVLNYSQSSVFSMDCYNAIEWKYDLICPVCRMINHFEDGSC